MTKDITVIITTFKSEERIENCLNSIESKIKVLIIENSNSKDFKSFIENKFKNVECILPGSNLGYSKANNLALSKVKTSYALILNPDTILDKDSINNFFNFTKKVNEFAIVGPDQSEKFNDLKSKNSNPEAYETDSIKGYAMFLNMKKFKKIGFFDENFFLYLEEIDICKKVLKNKLKIYVEPKIRVFHYGAKAASSKYYYEVELCRNWHWMWSLFYFNKKHKNFFYALILTLPYILSSIIKLSFYSLLFNKKRDIYYARLSGLINSILGKPSWYRPNIYLN